MVDVGGESDVEPVEPVGEFEVEGVAVEPPVPDDSAPSVSPVIEPELVQAASASRGTVNNVVRMGRIIANRRRVLPPSTQLPPQVPSGGFRALLPDDVFVVSANGVVSMIAPLPRQAALAENAGRS